MLAIDRAKKAQTRKQRIETALARLRDQEYGPDFSLRRATEDMQAVIEQARRAMSSHAVLGANRR